MNTKKLQKEINEGNIEATELIAGAGLKEEQAKRILQCMANISYWQNDGRIWQE